MQIEKRKHIPFISKGTILHYPGIGRAIAKRDESGGCVLVHFPERKKGSKTSEIVISLAATDRPDFKIVGHVDTEDDEDCF